MTGTLTEVADASLMATWHKGRRNYYIWMYRLCDPRLAELAAEARMLAGTVVELCPLSALHLTVFVAGFICRKKIHNDDIEQGVLSEQIANLQREHLPPAKLEVTGITATEHYIMFEVIDSTSTTATIRHALQQSQPEIRFAPYRQHITIAYYKNVVPLDRVQKALLQSGNKNQPLVLTIDALELVSMDAQSRIDETIGLCLDHYETQQIFWLKNRVEPG